MPRQLSFACRDIGLSCDARMEAPSKEELMRKIQEHARTAHNMQTIDKETQRKIESAIKSK